LVSDLNTLFFILWFTALSAKNNTIMKGILSHHKLGCSSEIAEKVKLVIIFSSLKVRNYTANKQ
jgi:hypothetical protein